MSGEEGLDRSGPEMAGRGRGRQVRWDDLKRLGMVRRVRLELVGGDQARGVVRWGVAPGATQRASKPLVRLCALLAVRVCVVHLR